MTPTVGWAEAEVENRRDHIGEMIALAAHPAWRPSG